MCVSRSIQECQHQISCGINSKNLFMCKSGVILVFSNHDCKELIKILNLSTRIRECRRERLYPCS